jgi:hypothetical protein
MIATPMIQLRGTGPKNLLSSDSRRLSANTNHIPAGTVRTLLEANLVDELRLMVFPTVLGRGKRLFPEGIDRLKLRLAQSKEVGSDGVQIQIYQRAE